MTHDTGQSPPSEIRHRRRRFTVVKTQPEFAERLEVIQRACFPTISRHEIITAEQYRAHIEVFPEGQHTVLNEEGVPVACSTDIRRNIDFAHYQHTYLEVTGNNWLTTHEEDGEWLYGCDISVAPEYRGMKLSQKLYAARRGVAYKFNLRGHVAGSMLKGYHRHKNKMTAEAYVDKVVSGQMSDPVLSVHLRRKFEVVGVLQDYNVDPTTDNKAAFIVWYNPDYETTPE